MLSSKLLDFLWFFRFKLGRYSKHTRFLVFIAKTHCQEDSSEYFEAMLKESFRPALLVFDDV